MKFQDLPYIRPDQTFVISGIQDCTKQLKNAQNFTQADAAFTQFHQIMEEFHSMCQIADIRFTQDVREPFYNQENDVLGEMVPVVDEAAHAFYQALLSCPYQEEIDKKYHPMLLKKLSYQSAGGGEAITALKQEENHLMAQFQEINSTSQIRFRGKTIPAQQLYSYKGSKDRSTRIEAYQAEGAYFLNFKEQLEDIADRLIKNRNAQAKALGFKDYSELSLIHMNRMGYGLNEIAHYRELVKKHWVPVVKEIKERQRKRLGLDVLKGYDNLLYFPDYNPTPKGDSSQMLFACRTMFHGLSEETGRFFDSLIEKGMFDLDSREGKAPGGYCGSVDSEKSPFIFSNFNGTTMDIDVLIHESGHAFAAYEAYKNNIVPECREASSEICETHSTAMELLTMPYHHLFFKEDADRYDLFLMERTLTYLPGGCLNDEFLTLLHQNPDMSAKERHTLYRELRKIYEPHFSDFDDIALYAQGEEWLIDSQLFLCPFYFVDYGLARNISLQLLMLQQNDPKLAWDKYLQFLSYGGTKNYIDAVHSIDLKVPFEEDILEQTINRVFDWMKKKWY